MSSDEATLLRKNFAKFLAPLYVKDPYKIAEECDERIDRTGVLLGYVREEAAKLNRETLITKHKIRK